MRSEIRPIFSMSLVSSELQGFFVALIPTEGFRPIHLYHNVRDKTTLLIESRCKITQLGVTLREPLNFLRMRPPRTGTTSHTTSTRVTLNHTLDHKPVAGPHPAPSNSKRNNPVRILTRTPVRVDPTSLSSLAVDLTKLTSDREHKF